MERSEPRREGASKTQQRHQSRRIAHSLTFCERVVLCVQVHISTTVLCLLLCIPYIQYVQIILHGQSAQYSSRMYTQ